MSLTSGHGPLSGHAAGRLSPPLLGPVSYTEPYRKRVHATLRGRTVVESERVVLVHRPGRPPTYAFPIDDVDGSVVAVAAELNGYVEVAWRVVDQWFEEGEPIQAVRNPYHRIDFVTGGRRLHILANGVSIVETTETTTLYETALEPRLYVATSVVQGIVLLPSTTSSFCPYKGTASYFTGLVNGTQIDDIAWSYQDPIPEASPIKGLLSFDPQRVTVEHDIPPAAI